MKALKFILLTMVSLGLVACGDGYSSSIAPLDQQNVFASKGTQKTGIVKNLSSLSDGNAETAFNININANFVRYGSTTMASTQPTINRLLSPTTRDKLKVEIYWMQSSTANLQSGTTSTLLSSIPFSTICNQPRIVNQRTYGTCSAPVGMNLTFDNNIRIPASVKQVFESSLAPNLKMVICLAKDKDKPCLDSANMATNYMSPNTFYMEIPIMRQSTASERYKHEFFIRGTNILFNTSGSFFDDSGNCDSGASNDGQPTQGSDTCNTDQQEQAPPPADPLALDLGSSNTIKTVGLDKGVIFDLDSDGIAEKVGWVQSQPNAPIALLALDLNHNGIIDDGSELFGDATMIGDIKAHDGFEALAYYDSNHDGVIDAKDAIFSELLLWIDEGQLGICEQGEIHHLSDLGITKIELNYLNMSEVDVYGNWTYQRSFFWKNVAGIEVPAKIADLWFIRALHNEI